jgi:protein TonB
LDIVAAPVEVATGLVGPSEEETDKIFDAPQIPSSFPGGQSAWVKFLSINLNRDLPIENGAPAGIYKVIVSVVVSRDGSISNVRAENDPGYGTAAEAVRVIQKGPKWTPAEQNGYKVISRHKQMIAFQVTEE